VQSSYPWHSMRLPAYFVVHMLSVSASLTTSGFHNHAPSPDDTLSILPHPLATHPHTRFLLHSSSLHTYTYTYAYPAENNHPHTHSLLQPLCQHTRHQGTSTLPAHTTTGVTASGWCARRSTAAATASAQTTRPCWLWGACMAMSTCGLRYSRTICRYV
jgi:hypothetical protein